MADLRWADLHRADMSGADLKKADLEGAQGITEEQLAVVKSLEDATMPDGRKHR
jgi:uncharacterized protein YjbI with pentapeptide repeats